MHNHHTPLPPRAGLQPTTDTAATAYLTVRIYRGQRRLGILWYRGFTVLGHACHLAR